MGTAQPETVCSIDTRASSAGAELLTAGGSAADAAVGASAVLAVVAPYACGMGGDLFALVAAGSGQPACLNASGRSGSGLDAADLRAEGHDVVPRHRHPAAVTVPGCVDGWLALHQAFGRLPLDAVLQPALTLARDGFAASASLAGRVIEVATVEGNSDFPESLTTGAIVTRPGTARALEAILADGRGGFYQGEFGDGLKATCPQISTADLKVDQADWVDPLGARVWNHDLWTVPPNSQGYLTLAAALLLQGIDLPSSPDAGLWAHLTVEAARQAGFDRGEALYAGAEGEALLDESRLAPRRQAIDADRASRLGAPHEDGGTIYLCAVDGDGAGVSLIQSNAQGFGALLTAAGTSIFLHNRGLGFSLEPGHPAEYSPGTRPPHTLSPAMVTRPNGSLRAVLGTMGGDAQPQVLLQILARLLDAGESPQRCIDAPRWALGPPAGADGFSTWSAGGDVRVLLEPTAPESWASGLTARGHHVTTGVAAASATAYGHAHLIEVDPDGSISGAADPRAPESATVTAG